MVTSAFANIADGRYLLTLVKAPDTFEVPPGDEGGPITAGANHPGVIAIGDLDPWTFTANKNDAILLNIGEPILSEVDPGSTRGSACSDRTARSWDRRVAREPHRSTDGAADGDLHRRGHQCVRQR